MNYNLDCLLLFRRRSLSARALPLIALWLNNKFLRLTDPGDSDFIQTETRDAYAAYRQAYISEKLGR